MPKERIGKLWLEHAQALAVEPGEKECTIEDLTRVVERLSRMPQGHAVEIVNGVIELCAMQLATGSRISKARCSALSAKQPEGHPPEWPKESLSHAEEMPEDMLAMPNKSSLNEGKEEMPETEALKDLSHRKDVPLPPNVPEDPPLPSTPEAPPLPNTEDQATGDVVVHSGH
eukprot:Skav216727  [mRNA]  locus=scaffold653:94867:95382:+ [translate_table: standard]